MARTAREPFRIAGREVPPGERLTLDLRVARLYTHTEVTMPVQVVHGRRPGPRLFVCAAVHGDEINGVEIVRRLLGLQLLERLRGVLVAVPVVNVHGLLHHSRYLPDRRDLNRSFPGSPRGSLTARLAHLFMEEVVARCTHGIDLHSAAVHRSNLPQVRADLSQPETRRLARAFGAPVVLDASLRDGSLRQAARERGLPLLLYEAGEALRFDELGIRAGVRGVVNVMRALGMLPPPRGGAAALPEPLVARASGWVRAPQSGILRGARPLGARVARGELLAVVADPFGEREQEVRAPAGGLIIGRTEIPLVNEGDALFHIARFARPREAARRVEAFQEAHAGEGAWEQAWAGPEAEEGAP